MYVCEGSHSRFDAVDDTGRYCDRLGIPVPLAEGILQLPRLGLDWLDAAEARGVSRSRGQACVGASAGTPTQCGAWPR